MGCRVNQYETTALAELFIKSGYKVVNFSEKSDLYIINTCAVTAESERKSAQMIRRAIKMGGRVAVVGCYSQLDTALGGIKGVSFVGGSKDKTAVFRESDHLLDDNNLQIVADTNLRGYSYEHMEIGNEKTTNFSICRAFVKIQDGCNGRCSYCIIPKTRGPVRSRPLVDIISEVERLADNGYKEIVLTGIEISAYDYAPLSELIRLIDNVKGIERLRFGSLSPNSITDDFLEAAKNSSCFMPHMHLSIQSGSERILRLMRRPYNKRQMCAKIEKVYQAMPKTLISTDMIVGFPTETEDDFLNTLQVVSDYNLSHVHAFPFSSRPGTEAAAMEGKIPVHEVKKRNERLIMHSHDVKNQILKSKIGTKEKVLIEKISQNPSGNKIWLGHSEDFLETKIVFHTAKTVGDIAEVDIMSYDNSLLIGKEA